MDKKVQVQPKVGDKIFVKLSVPFSEIKGTTATVKDLATNKEYVIIRKGTVDYYLYQDEYELLEDN